ncbi:hypothetical protein [Brevibacillus dissolubilis]|uniref:hypothetical protein n=1 Tax=Brevibacillus dissolubilis TaxID=1844116 RepID=UPI0021005491|nr:hypothetical protein [Brevibacillus dissolubilis]
MKAHPIPLMMAAVLLLTSTACGNSDQNQANPHAGHQQNQPAPAADGHTDHQHPNGEQNAQVKAAWTFTPTNPQPQEKTTVQVQIQDKAGQPIQQFDINHEYLMHLIAVSSDLSYFDHLHPTYKEDGQFELTTAFPAGGDYKLIADFIPTGQAAMSKSVWVTVGGDAPAPTPLTPDENLTKVVDGKEVTLQFNKDLQAGEEVELTFSFQDAQTKQPITNLEPYLGAAGHVVIISGDTEQYLHNHPTDEKSTGPKASFMTAFPTSGLYKIWGQFQHQGNVFIVPYVVNVT